MIILEGKRKWKSSLNMIRYINLCLFKYDFMRRLNKESLCYAICKIFFFNRFTNRKKGFILIGESLLYKVIFKYLCIFLWCYQSILLIFEKKYLEEKQSILTSNSNCKWKVTVKDIFHSIRIIRFSWLSH